MQPLDPHPIKIPYTNYRGETSERTITPIRPWFGSTEWHPEPQWLLRAYDHDKGAERDFAFKDFGSLPLVPPGDKEMYLAGMTEAAEIADAAFNCSCDQCEGRRVAANFIRERITEIADKPDEAGAQGEGSFQDRVKPWMLACFGEEISNDKLERCDRFIEEALELVQAIGYSPDRAHALVDYVFNREVGEPHQEVGGVMVTLAALCLASGLDMDKSGEDELARIWTKIEKIRAKRATKPTGSALPVPTSGGEE